jgi:heme exporter protein A
MIPGACDPQAPGNRFKRKRVPCRRLRPKVLEAGGPLSADQTLLECENLHLWRGERHVLRGVSLRVAPGECLLVRGPNGAGKTTLLRAACGIAYLEEGRVLWRGKDMREDPAAFHGELAYIGHEPPLKGELSAAENLRYWIGVRRPVSGSDVRSALDRVGGGAFGEQPVRTLSAGQKRRATLAGLVLMAVPLWVLDEPTTNLDAAGSQLVATLIDEHLAGGGLVMAAIHHDLPLTAPGVRQHELSTRG